MGLKLKGQNVEKKKELLPLPVWYKCEYWEGIHYTIGEIYPSYREGMLIANDGMPRMFRSPFAKFKRINMDCISSFIKKD